MQRTLTGASVEGGVSQWIWENVAPLSNRPRQAASLQCADLAPAQDLSLRTPGPPTNLPTRMTPTGFPLVEKAVGKILICTGHKVAGTNQMIP